jgi:hypothetical protein
LDLEARIAQFEGDPERALVLRRARSFKASWVELGESLYSVLKNESYSTWGYDSFEAYCQKELHLRKETAFKLTGSYTFLQTRAPKVLRRDGTAAPIPSLASVEFWKRADERAQEEDTPKEALVELERAVVEEAQPASALKRRYKEVFFPLGKDEKHERARREVVSAARRLSQLLSETRIVPKRLSDDCIETIEEILGELAPAKEAEEAEEAA